MKPKHMEESFGYMAEALILAIVFVYLILAAQFESFIDPLAIMLSLPLSLVGMAGMLLLTRDTVNMMSLIGLILLMGLVTKNAILLVDYTKVLRSRGMERREAIITAGRTRLRPIMMTTLAMIFGMLPSGPGPGGRVGDAGPHGPGGDRRVDHLHLSDPAGGPGGLLPAGRPGRVVPPQVAEEKGEWLPAEASGRSRESKYGPARVISPVG